MGSCAAPSAKGDDKFITTDYLQQCHAEGARKAMMAHLSFVHTTIKRFDEDQARQARITRLPGDHNEMTRENKS